jgi:hypothetical protein
MPRYVTQVSQIERRTAPTSTIYDEESAITYALDDDREGADWRAVARIVLHIDSETEADRGRRAFDSHLSRAKWISRWL